MLLWDSAVISIASNTVNISNNEPADRKGIFINNSTDKLKLSGDISLVSPIYLYFENENSSPAVTVAGTLSENTVATIKLVGSFATEGKLVLEAEEKVALTDEIIAKFTLENEEFYIDTNGKLAKINTEQNLITKLSSITANGYGVKQLPSGVYYLEQNLELDAPVYISSGDVVIYAKNNATISGNINNDCFFSVINCSLTFGKDELTDATLTIDAGKKSDASAVLNAGSSGTLNLKNNVICTGATNQSFITTANGTVNISGGKIKENHGASPVINVTGGTVNITGGEISNNSCINLSEDCPAILVSRGTLNISGTTTTISNNTYGISDDTLVNQGASIYNEGGAVTILGTTLDQGNKFTQNIVNGVKEDVQNSGSIALEGTEVETFDALKAAINGTAEVIIITKNITITECLNIERAVTIAANTDVTVTDNSMYSDGSSDYAFWVKDGGKLTLGGGSEVLTFKQATGKNYETIGTAASKATIEININDNVKFTENKYYCITFSAGTGAVLYINGGEFVNNSYTPICISNENAVCYITGGTIANNSSSANNCAGIYVKYGNLTITGGDITNNTYTSNNSYSGSSIRAPVAGKGTVTINGTAITESTTYTTNIIDGKPQE